VTERDSEYEVEDHGKERKKELHWRLANMIEMQLQRARMKRLSASLDLSLNRRWAWFCRISLYHLAQIFCCGPIAFLFVALFSGLKFAANTAFGCQLSMLRYAIYQNLQWFSWTISLAILVYERLSFGSHEQSLYPLILLTGCNVFLTVVIGSKHATMSDKMNHGLLTKKGIT
jgi:hypothetical protein